MARYVLPETIADRFGISLEELALSRARGLAPGRYGYTIPDPVRGRRLVYPANLQPDLETRPADLDLETRSGEDE